MKRFLLLIVLTFISLSAAQEVSRVVVLPFDATNSEAAYGSGLATALQRSLNVVDNVYVPPVGDAFLYIRRLIEEDRVSVANVAEAFDAPVVVSGQVTTTGEQATVLLGFAGPDYPESEDVTVTGPANDPAALVARVVDAVAAELQLPVSGTDRQELNSVTAQTPSLASLAAVSQSALRLPSATLTDLASAAANDADSGWAQSEYARALALSNDTQAALDTSLAAVENAPNDIEAWVVRGVVLQSAGLEDAAAAFDAALALNPAHALALAGKGEVAQDTAALNAAITSYPRLVDAYTSLAELQAETAPQRALQTLRRGTTAIPDSLTLHRSLMNIVMNAGDAAGALAYLRNEVLGRQENPPAALYSLAATLPEDFTNQALAIVQQGLESYPNNPTLARAAAELYERQEDFANAEAVLQGSLEANPGNTEVANTLAVVQARQGNLDAAEATLSSLGGDDTTTQYNLAQLYLDAGQAEAALNVAEPLAQTSPNDAGVQALYGIALGRVGRVEEANTAFERALTLNPDQPEAQRARALLEQQQGLTGGRTVELEDDAASAFDEGQSALEAGDYPAAAAAFTRARTAQDEGTIAFYQGYALYLSGETRAAADAYTRALETYPESDVVLNNLGLAQVELGRYDLAMTNLNQAISLNDQNANAHLNLGLANYELGRYAAAVTAWERALEVNPELNAAIAERLEDARSRVGQ